LCKSVTHPPPTPSRFVYNRAEIVNNGAQYFG
jgi:hypothetical protein